MPEGSVSPRPGFLDYIGSDLAADILPLIPPGAIQSAASGLSASGWAANAGKMPGRYKPDESAWVGFGKWSQHEAGEGDLREWAGWPGAGVCILTRNMVAVDIDILDAGFAKWVKALAERELGASPCRIGRAPKCTLFYRPTTPLRKTRLPIHQIGEDTPAHAVEFLGAGQHTVLNGIHPKTGQPYRWEGGHIRDIGRAGLTEVTPDQLADFMRQVAAEAERRGYVLKGAVSDIEAAGERRLGRKAPEDFVADTPEVLEQARHHLTYNALPGCYDNWYRETANLLDMGCSVELAADLMATVWSKSWPAGEKGAWDDEQWLGHVSEYHANTYENEVGCGYIPPRQGEPTPNAGSTMADAFGEVVKSLPVPDFEKGPVPGSKEYFLSRFLTPDNWHRVERVPMLIEGFLPATGLATLSGSRGNYKSFTMANIMYSVVTGLPCFGSLAVQRTGPVVYCLGEDPEGMIKDRLPALETEYGARFGDGLAHNLAILPEVVPFLNGAARYENLMSAIDHLLKGEKPSLFIIDTLARAEAGINTNQPHERALSVQVLEMIAARFQCLVLVVSHTGKTDKSAMVGAEAVDNAAGSVWMVEGDNGAVGLPASARRLTLIPGRQRSGNAGIKPIYLGGKAVHVEGSPEPGMIFTPRPVPVMPAKVSPTKGQDADWHTICGVLSRERRDVNYKAIRSDALIGLICGSPPPASDQEAHTAWKALRTRWQSNIRRWRSRPNAPATLRSCNGLVDWTHTTNEGGSEPVEGWYLSPGVAILVEGPDLNAEEG